MGMYNIGDVIKQMRKNLLLTQEELCDGICSAETLSRIENGRQIPGKSTFQALMERMGRDGERYIPLIHSDEINMIKEWERINSLFEKRKYYELDSALTDFEAYIDIEDHVNRQFIIRARALNDYFLHRINEKEKRIRLIQAVQCTIPHFDGKNIPDGIFNQCERRLFCNIAVSYAEEKQFDKAIDILKQLEKHISSTCISGEQKSELMGLLLSNMSQILGQTGEIQEALLIGEKGLNMCLHEGSGGRLAQFLYNTGFDMELLGIDEKKCKERLIQAYYVAELNENWEQMDHIKKHWEQKYSQKMKV